MILLAVDMTAILLSIITGFFGLASLIVTLLINKKVNKVAKEVNGHTTLLLESKDQTSEAKQSAKLATGKLEAIAAMSPDKPELMELSKEENTPVSVEKDAVIDVNIVDQHKPVEVIAKTPESKPKKK